VWAVAISQVAAVALLLTKFPFEVTWRTTPRHMKSLLTLGVQLLLSNVTFYAIFIITRTVIGARYSIADMGRFTFAYTMMNAVFLGSNALTFVLYPHLLWHLRAGQERAHLERVVNRVTELYSSAIYGLAFSVMAVVPLVFTIAPAYRTVGNTLNLLILSQAIYSGSMAYAALAFAQKRVDLVLPSNLLAVACFAGLATLLGEFGWSFKYLSLTIMMAILFYSILQVRAGVIVLERSEPPLQLFRRLLPTRLCIPLAAAATLNLTDHAYIGAWLGAVLFVGCNGHAIRVGWSTVNRVRRSENVPDPFETAGACNA
jgi:O-antigen/teichoic acid export membrane protein